MSRRIASAAALALALACARGSVPEPAALTTPPPAPAADPASSAGGSPQPAGTGTSSDGGTAPAPVAVVSLSILPAAPSVPQGAQEQLTATALFSDGTSSDVTAQAAWSVSDTSAATVFASSDGLEWVKGLRGSATISASYSTVSASAQLTVTAPALTELALNRADVSMAAGTSLQLGAIGLYTDGSRRDVTAEATWTSSDANVATSVGAGLFAGAAAGGAVAAAALGGLSAATSVTVTAATLTAIDLAPADASIAAGTQQAYTATGIFSDYSTQDLTAEAAWSSSQASVAAISGAVASAAAAGTTVISAAVLGVTASTTLTVTAATLTGIEISPVLPSIAAGTATGFSASGLFSDGSVQDLTAQAAWSSSDPTVAAIDAGGIARGLSAGNVTISASFGGFSDSTTLTVSPATLSSIAIANADAPLPAATDRQLSAVGTFSDGSTEDLTGQVLWVSSNPAVAFVSSDGVLHGIAQGSAQVYASLLGMTGSAAVTISAAVLTSIAIGPASPTVPVKYWTQLTATGTFSDGTTVALTGQAVWISSNTTVASISGTTGVVTGLAAGTSLITARFGGVAGTATLTVVNTKLSSISLSPSSLSLAAGSSATLVATGTFANGFSMDVTAQVRWTSSNRNVAVAGNSARGVVRAIAAGTATITATRSGKSGSAAVTVN